MGWRWLNPPNPSRSSSCIPLLLIAVAAVAHGGHLPLCRTGNPCETCELEAALATSCSAATQAGKRTFLYCNVRTRKVDVDTSSYLECNSTTGRWQRHVCGTDGDRQFYFRNGACVDPTRLAFHAQATSGSGRVGDVCSFNTDCLGGMFCSAGLCRCLSTFVAVDSYCYEKISPAESGCFYDVQCSSVWPDSTCKNGMCYCPSELMVAHKTRDGVLCVWTSSAEPICPLPNIPPPDSPSALVVLPAPAGQASITVAICNPHSTKPPPTDEEMLTSGHKYGCAARSTDLQGSGTPQDLQDIYDCIDNSEFWKAQGIDTAAQPVGVCCMNRAFTCIQPKRGEVDTIGAIPRWWWNAVAGSCQQFLFDTTSSDVSPNNFETLSHCESYCKETCMRGSPAYQQVAVVQDQYPVTGCSSATPCADPFVCTDVASQQLCCLSRKSICSTAGGRLKDPMRSTQFDPGMRFDQLTGETADAAPGLSTRYYFNSENGCQSFTYNGYLGNLNNFLTLSDCQQFCSRLQCAHGSPLVNGQGTPQRCQRDSECPTTHTCSTEHGVCCATPQTLCTEPKRVGDCKQNVHQYWYNAETRTCEVFQYTGCQGNNNRFESLNACNSYCRNVHPEPKCPQGRAYMDGTGKFLQCSDAGNGNTCPANFECYFDGLTSGCCPTKSYTCSLQVNKGTRCGSGSSYRFYFNAQLKECASFLFHGCDGNSNNFPTVTDCQNYCDTSSCPHGGSPLRINNQIRTCTTQDPCPTGYECSLVNVHGRTQKRCCPTRASICSRVPSMGAQPKCASNNAGQSRYYFNVALKECQFYSSNSCDQSLNSFSSRSECEDFCLGAGCSHGDQVYKDPNTARPFACNPALQNSCPLNYNCVLNSIVSENFCCGSDARGVCPDGEKAFIDSKLGAPRECMMNAEGKCPPGYLCRFSIQHNRYYCCGSADGSYCPSGKALFRYSTTQSPIQCTISPFTTSCPPGFTCISDVPGAFQGYCCSKHAICPGGVRFHLDEKTQMPTSCTRDSFSFCPTGFTCQQQPETSNFYCCTGREENASQEGCPPNEFVYMVEGSAYECDPFNPKDRACPQDYSCQWSTARQRYQCCGTCYVTEDGCSNHHFALIDKSTAKPRLCTAAEPKSCPTGFFCQFSAARGQFQCCGRSAGCPPRRAAFIAVDGNAQECLPGPSGSCQDGYECTKNSNGKHICCSVSTSLDCSDDEEEQDGECVLRRKKSWGDSCLSDKECASTPFALCREAKCQCPPDGFVFDGEKCREGDCDKDQVSVNGQCVDRVEIGAACESSFQCAANARCIMGICDCAPGERPLNGRCVKGPAALCPLPGSRPYYEKGSTQLKECEPKKKDVCPKSFSCQYSDAFERHICCSAGRTAPATSEETTEPSLPSSSSSNQTEGICPTNMTPYLVNGKPRSCTTSTCPYGYSCKYAPTKRDYFCCIKQNSARSSKQRRQGGCPRGSALIFPSTGEPLYCDPPRRPCPSGFDCLRSVGSGRYQCCSHH